MNRRDFFRLTSAPFAVFATGSITASAAETARPNWIPAQFSEQDSTTTRTVSTADWRAAMGYTKFSSSLTSETSSFSIGTTTTAKGAGS
jgi:hypothetical protein